VKQRQARLTVGLDKSACDHEIFRRVLEVSIGWVWIGEALAAFMRYDQQQDAHDILNALFDCRTRI
jgi:hypothetical protein